MKLGDIYRFLVSIPNRGWIEFHPLNDTIEWTDVFDDDYSYFARSLASPLVFADDSLRGYMDFTYIYQIERNRLRQLRIPIRVQHRCVDTDPWIDVWLGNFRLGDCEFDVDHCIVNVEVNQNPPEQCLNKTDVNFMYSGRDNLVMDYIGWEMTGVHYYEVGGNYYSYATLQDFLDGIPYTDYAIDPAEGWAVVESTAKYNSGDPADTTPWEWTTVFAREFVSGSVSPPTSDPNWINLGGGDWARTPALVQGLFQLNITSGIRSIKNERVFPEGGIQNGQFLNPLLEYLLSQTCSGYELRSDFFGINPDGTAPLNDPYTEAAALYQHLVLYPTHDIAKTDETQSSFRIEHSPAELIEDLKQLFNLKFMWVGGGIVRLEHVTYGGSYRLNLIDQPDRVKLITGQWQYEYDTARIPAREVWTLPYEREVQDLSQAIADLSGTPIVYPESVHDYDAGDEAHNVRLLYNDLAHIVKDERFEGTTTFFIAVAQPDGTIINGTGYGSGTPLINADMGIPYLHERFWRYDRYSSSGKMNNNDTVFFDDKELRTQEITIPMCCSDYVLFDPSDRVKTQLNWGRITEATYTAPTGILTLTTRHK